jgi:hypothetical protein
MIRRVEIRVSLDFEKIKSAAGVSTLGSVAQKLARLEEGRASWRSALAQSDSVSKQLRELSGVGSIHAQMMKDVMAWKTPAMSIAQQYKDLMGEESSAMQTIRQWQEAQRAQDESIRKMIEPLADIRKSLLLDTATQKLLKDFAGLGSINDRFKEVVDQATRMDATTALWAKQIEDSQTQTKKILEGMTLGSSVQNYLKEFEQINKQWRVAPELLNVVGSLKELQSQFGKLALPTIDWGSAATLAKLLGTEGLEEQLAYLGIESDGSLREATEAPEKGLLSRKQSDAVALLGLLLSIIAIWMTVQIFICQENAGAAQQAKNVELADRQFRQLESLNRLVEKALTQATKEQEEHLVVRERIASVRSKPEHGASVQGKLLPNEVVRAIDKDGKWIEVEYYHWLHEEYRTGWVLKKYLERVPASRKKGQ